MSEEQLKAFLEKVKADTSLQEKLKAASDANAASAIAKKLKSRRLLLMTNVEGVYDDRKTLISEIKPYDMENLVNLKIVQGGMLPKIKNCIDAVENGVRGVVILDGRKPRAILKEIFSDQGAGTLIRK